MVERESGELDVKIVLYQSARAAERDTTYTDCCLKHLVFSIPLQHYRLKQAYKYLTCFDIHTDIFYKKISQEIFVV